MIRDIQTPKSAYHDKLQRSCMHSLRSKRSTKPDRLMMKKRAYKEDNDPQLTGEANCHTQTAMHDMADMIVSHSSDQLLSTVITVLQSLLSQQSLLSHLSLLSYQSLPSYQSLMSHQPLLSLQSLPSHQSLMSHQPLLSLQSLPSHQSGTSVPTVTTVP